MKFIDQVQNLKIRVVNSQPLSIYSGIIPNQDATQPTVMRENGVYVRYINVNNPSMSIIRGDKFFDTLEELYKQANSGLNKTTIPM